MKHEVFLGNLIGPQQLKKFLAFYGSQIFLTVFTRARHLFLFRIACIFIDAVSSYFFIFILILILSSSVRLGHQSPFFTSGLPTKHLYLFFVSLIAAACPAHLTLLDLVAQLYCMKMITKPTKELTEGRRLALSRKSTSLGLFGYACVNRIAGPNNRHLNPLKPELNPICYLLAL